MKYRYKIAALLAAVTLTSCTIDIIGPDGPGRDIDTPRTIAVSFAPQTKSALSKEDGLAPEFQPGDKILVSNGRNYDTRPIDFDHNGGASFTTDLTGELIAVYPAKAAILKGSEITGVSVPSLQTGRFEEANIAKAKIPEGASKAYFENQTAVLKFYVDASIGVNAIEISSDKLPIADNESLVIHVKNDVALDQVTDDPMHRIAYVAVLPGKFTQLTFISYTKTQAEVKRVFNNVSLPASTLANVFIPYYIPVNVSKDSKPEYQYWAYCNLGAFLPEEPGHYFTWGNTYGYVPKNYEEDEDDVEWFLPSGEPAPVGGFTNDNYTKTQGSKLTGNITAENDAATVALGGKWRMPAKSEFDALVSATTWTASGWEEIYGKRGKYFVDKDGSRIFLPTTGNVYADEMQYTRQEAHYWSSVLSTEGQNQAYGLYYWGTPSISSTYRYNGCPIRPIYGDPLPEGNGLEANKYNEGPTL